MDQDIANWRF